MFKRLSSTRVSSIIRTTLLVFGLGLIHSASADVPPHLTMGKPATEFLPNGTTFDENVPSPESFFGFNIGKWHIRHDQLVAYMYALADSSDRVTVEETGKTHQDQPLILVKITSPDNHGQLESLRETHLQNIIQQRSAANNAPLFLYMGYGIHGNEPSGTNAALLIAYYLAAGNDTRIDKMLQETVVLIDPSLNPDGASRFAQWTNMHRGYQLNKSKYHREHLENWPSSRTNYYWFDLNRDWLLLTHPESKARINQFHKWRPHILTDYHEMGTDSTYFFQPGVRSRKNPLTPEGNVTLTEALAKFHAKALDANNQLYFTEEGFDDFYYGKGSSYPDAHGSIGILFEQGSSRGHIQESINGDLRFDQTIQNQITTSLSTFDGALANKAALLNYQLSFAKQTESLIKDDEMAGVLLKQPNDVFRFDALLDKLDAHNINYNVIIENGKGDDLAIVANRGVFVPFDQVQYRLIKSLFSERKSFPDNTFYDVSNWNIALAFDVDYEPITARQARQLKTSSDRTVLRSYDVPDTLENNVGYAFDWYHFQAPALANRLLQNGIQLRVSAQPFSSDMTGSTREFNRGTVVIPRAFNQSRLEVAIQIAKRFNIPLWPIKTGLTSKGIDLGSRNLVPLLEPKILLIGGEGTAEYEVGEIWHFFDTRVGTPVTIVDQNDIARITLEEFTHVIFARGHYGAMGELANKKLDKWLKAGGTIIGQKSALRFFNRKKWMDIAISGREDIDDAFRIRDLNYSDLDSLAAKKRISGSSYLANIDLTHPLFFGIDDPLLPLFKTDNIIVDDTRNPFETVATYTESPLLGGYTSEELQKLVSESAAVVTQRVGKGRVIGFVDNVNFRGYWYGSSKLMANAVFMSDLIR